MADNIGLLAAVAAGGMATTFALTMQDIPGVEFTGKTSLFLLFAILLIGVMAYSAFSR